MLPNVRWWRPGRVRNGRESIRRETPARVADVDESGADHRHGCGAAAAPQYPSRMSDREDATRRGREETEPEQWKQKTWRGRGVSVGSEVASK